LAPLNISHMVIPPSPFEKINWFRWIYFTWPPHPLPPL
jgi:hypothetical protein